MILASFILAIKYNEESYYLMSYYSKLGGVSLFELKNLESEFLILIRYKLFVETKLFDKYYNDLMSLKNEDNDYEEYEEENEEQDVEEDEKEKKEEKYKIKGENFEKNNKNEKTKENKLIEDLYSNKNKINININN